jgi:hypothetical protein
MLVVASLVPLLVVATLYAAVALRQERLSMERDAVDYARRLSEIIDHELEAQIEAVRAIAALPLFDANRPEEAFAEMARRVAPTQPLWLGLILSDRDGNRLASFDGRPGRVVDETSHRRVVETKASLVGHIIVGPRGNPALAIRAPVLRNEEVAYVVSAVLSPDGLRDRLVKAALPQDWIGTVVDAAGNVVVRTAGPPDLIGKPASEPARAARERGGEGLYEGRTLEGIETISSYRLSPLTNWSVHIGIPKAIYSTPLTRSAALMGAGVLVAVILTAAFIFLLVRELRSRRHEALSLEHARRVEGLARLTGGVAHDFNNLLTVISGNLDLLERRTTSPEALRAIQSIRKAAERGSQISTRVCAPGGRPRGGPEQSRARHDRHHPPSRCCPSRAGGS